MKIPIILEKITDELQIYCKAIVIVGGSVRDYLLKKNPKDFDVEVYGISSLKELEKILQKYGKVNIVGKSFGVLKLKTKDYEFDFSLPRLEKKIAIGHKGFEVTCDTNLTYKEAFKRRDFTINAIGYDILTKEYIDPFGGRKDLDKKILRHIDSKTFVEDPLRVYRAIQFYARFELKIDKYTKELIKKMVNQGTLEELPKERIFEEWKKLLLKAKKPSLGLELMREIGVLKYYPELKALIGVKQDPKYHPEGDVWTHTLLALDKLKERDLKLKFAILCHDMGKAITTKEIDGKITSRGHEEAGVEIAKNFLKRLSDDKKLIKEVLPLVRWHFAPSAFFKQKAKNRAIRRLSTKVNIKELVKVAKADFLGRDVKEAKSGEFEAGEWLLKKAKELQVEKAPPKPLITGKDLIQLGLKPSPKFKIILDKLYQMQLDGKLQDKSELIKLVKNLTII